MGHHMTTIAIDYDDAEFQRYVDGCLKDDVKKDLEAKAWNKLCRDIPKRQYSEQEDVKAWMEDVVAETLSGWKDEIVSLAALTLAMRAGRTGKWRDVLKEAKSEIGSEQEEQAWTD